MTERRMTRDQVEATINHASANWKRSTIEAICRDWLDMDALVEAVEDAGSWPLMDTAGYCATCGRPMVNVGWSRMDNHVPDCPGVRIANAIAAYDASDATEGDDDDA